MQLTLEAKQRNVFGKHLRALRRQGLLPGRVYGPHVAPAAVTLDAAAFQKVWSHAGAVSLVDLRIEGEQHTVLIRDVQQEPTTGRPLHVDLFAITMNEPLRVSVPIALVGEAPAVRQGGVLLRALDAVEVECLPADLPHQIDVDITPLAEMEAGIHVRDLLAPPRVRILTSGEELVAKVAAPAVRVVEAPAAPAPEAVASPAETTEERQAGV